MSKQEILLKTHSAATLAKIVHYYLLKAAFCVQFAFGALKILYFGFGIALKSDKFDFLLSVETLRMVMFSHEPFKSNFISYFGSV